MSGNNHAIVVRIYKRITHDPIYNTTKSECHRPVTSGRCTDKNVIYGILCEKCKSIVYVGETERSLKERIDEHVRDVRQGSEQPINKHFGNARHTEDNVSVAKIPARMQHPMECLTS